MESVTLPERFAGHSIDRFDEPMCRHRLALGEGSAPNEAASRCLSCRFHHLRGRRKVDVAIVEIDLE